MTTKIPHPQNNQITAAETGENAATVIKMQSGFVVMNRSQFLPGYCLLLGFPQASALNDLPLKKRGEFLMDMGLLGEAIEKVCKPKRLNYAILGNQDPFLHAHVIPRYDWESPALKPLSIWRYPDKIWTDEQHLFSIEKHGKLREEIKKTLLILIDQA